MEAIVGGTTALATRGSLIFKGDIEPTLWERLCGRVMKDAQIDRGQAERIVNGAIGFLKLCAEYPEEKFAPSKMVDVGWHTFILYTKEYADFCEKTAGYFIHHAPNDREVKADRTARDTVIFMQMHAFPFDPSVWDLKASDCTVDCTDDCNSCSNNSCTS